MIPQAVVNRVCSSSTPGWITVIRPVHTADTTATTPPMTDVMKPTPASTIEPTIDHHVVKKVEITDQPALQIPAITEKAPEKKDPIAPKNEPMASVIWLSAPPVSSSTWF